MRNFIFALALLLPVSAFAAAPPELGPYIKADSPYGAATLNKLFFHVYDATLWTDAATWSMQKPFALTLTYGMGFSAKTLAERSIDEMDGQAKLSPPRVQSYYAQLLKLFPDVKKGDHITALYLPGKETRLFYNGGFRGKISDKTFSERFIGIWMSPATSEPAVREKLLLKKD